MLKKVVES